MNLRSFYGWMPIVLVPVNPLASGSIESESNTEGEGASLKGTKLRCSIASSEITCTPGTLVRVDQAEEGTASPSRAHPVEECATRDIKAFSVPESAAETSEVQSTYTYFLLFIPAAMVQLIVEQMNLYSTQQTGNCVPTTPTEVHQFLAILSTWAGTASLPLRVTEVLAQGSSL